MIQAPWIGDDGFKKISPEKIDEIVKDYEYKIENIQEEIDYLEIILDGIEDKESNEFYYITEDKLHLENKKKELDEELEDFLEDPVERRYW